MTVSYFSALEARIPMTAAERMMDAAQSALYPHLTKDGGEKLWNGWISAARVSQPVPAAANGQAALFLWNGAPVAPADVKRNLSQSFGDRVQVA